MSSIEYNYAIGSNRKQSPELVNIYYSGLLSTSLAVVNKAQTLAPYGGAVPKISDEVFVAPNASVIGSVTIGKGSSVWYGAVLRGEVWCLNAVCAVSFFLVYILTLYCLQYVMKAT